MCNQNIEHLEDILKPETVAFVSYIINNNTGLKYENLIFEKRIEKFASVTTSHVMQLICNDGSRVEYWIINDITGNKNALAVRRIYAGEVDKDSIGFYQFIMRSYHAEGVIKAIKELPILKQVKH